MATRASTGNKNNSSERTAAKIRKRIPRIEVKRAESFRSDNPEGKRKLLNLWRSVTHTPLLTTKCCGS